MGIAVFGSFATDLTARSRGLPRAGQTLLGTGFLMGPGGKGSNQAVAAHRAGGRVTFITKIGQDMFGQVALDLYRGEGMDTGEILVSPDAPTGTAVIMVDEISAQNQIVMNPGACARITPEDVEARRGILAGAKVLLCQLEVNLDATAAAMAIARAGGAHVILNPAPAAPLGDDILAMVRTITPNETEAQALTGVEVTDRESACRAARAFFEKGVENVIITLGREGVFASDGWREEMVPGFAVDAVDTTGAGDAFNGAFAVAIDEGADLFEAVRFGNAAGALSVTKKGAAIAMPRRPEIDALLKR